MLDATKRDAFLDTTIGGATWNTASRSKAGSPLGNIQKPGLFHKTVTNFAQVRYDDNGGLNPVSPVKRGLSLNMAAAKATHPKEWARDSNSAMRIAKPSNDLDVSQRAVSVFQPKKIVSDVEQNKKMFKKFS